FFFQAEDGIRDRNVTGVQTCALPISPEFTGNTGFIYQKAVKTSCFRSFVASTTVTGFGTQYFDEANLLKQKPYFLWNLDLSISRSEERRVGKECSSRVWRCRERKEMW